MSGIERTPLLVAPASADSLIGAAMPSAELTRGLQRANPRLYVFDQDRAHSGVWLGKPGAPGTIFICAFHLGLVPEWTQIDESGRLIRKGWRAIFEKVIRSGATTRPALERIFRVSLATGHATYLCSRCVKEGNRNTHNGGKNNLCDFHEAIYDDARKSPARAALAEARAGHVRKRVYSR